MKTCFKVSMSICLLHSGSAALCQSVADLGPAPLMGITSGPSAGRVSAIACSPTDPELYYVGGPGGGVWRRDETSPGIYAWTPLTDGMPMLAVGAIAIDNNDEAIIYAGTGDRSFSHHSPYGIGLYKSFDSGNTWSHIAEQTFAGRSFSKIVLAPSNIVDPTLTLYAAIVRAGGFPEASAAKVHPGRWGDVGVFRSTDGGYTWTHLTLSGNGLPELSATDIVVDPTNSNTLYAVIGEVFGDNINNGVYKTVDGGNTWQKLTQGLPVPASPNTLGRGSIGISPSNPSVLYSAFTYGVSPSGSSSGSISTSFRSEDYGATWTQCGSNLLADVGWYAQAVSVHPSNQQIVFYGGLNVVGNNQCVPFIASVPHPDVHVFSWDASSRLLCGNDGGLHRSSNLGQTWESLNTGLSITQCYAGLALHPDGIDIFAGTQDNGVVQRYRTGMSDWDQVITGDGGYSYIDTTNGSPYRVYTTRRDASHFYRSDNGGMSFAQKSLTVTGAAAMSCPFGVPLGLPTTVVYCTQRTWVTADAGDSWDTLSTSANLTSGGGSAIRAIVIAPSDSSVVYCATNDYNGLDPDGRVLRSTDGGVSFPGPGTSVTPILTGNPGWRRITRELFVDPDDEDILYVARARFDDPVGQILRTTNGTSATPTFTDFAGPDFPNVPVNCVTVIHRADFDEVFAGTDSGLYYSNNNAQTWDLLTNLLPRAIIIDILYDQPNNRLILGTQGRGVWSVWLDSDWDYYADCEQDGDVDMFDITCFNATFQQADPYAVDIDVSSGKGVGDAMDVVSFVNKYTSATP